MNSAQHWKRHLGSKAIGSLLAAAVIALVPPPAASQLNTPLHASTGWSYQIAGAPVPTRGLLVLLPGYGGDFSDFSIPAGPYLDVAHRLAGQGIATLLIAPPAGALFGDSVHLRRMEDTIGEITRQLSQRPLPVAVGGFSSGGTDAVLLGERCGRSRCLTPHRLRAVFAVDAPLDYFRVWDQAQLSLEQRVPGSNLAEARLVAERIEQRLGGRPSPASPAYLSASPLAARQADGGNARYLVAFAVRAYVEPDVQWWMQNRGGDYYGLNALDAASLIRHLQTLGNTRAELIVASGKGYRGDGRRHPHSWSIVDEVALADWVGRNLLNASPEE